LLFDKRGRSTGFYLRGGCRAAEHARSKRSVFLRSGEGKGQESEHYELSVNLKRSGCVAILYRPAKTDKHSINNGRTSFGPMAAGREGKRKGVIEELAEKGGSMSLFRVAVEDWDP